MMGHLLLIAIGMSDFLAELHIARVALFLASDLADYIAGDMIVVDGGYLIS